MKSTHQNAKTVILVGKRQGALVAAAELGLRVILIDDKRARGRFSQLCDFNWSQTQWKAFGRDLRQKFGPVAAILALTEKSVVPAALLRQTYGMKGNTRKTSLLCTDKRRMKTAIRQAGLSCARFAAANQNLHREALIDELGLPMVIKTCIGSGGRGTYITQNAAEVPDGLPRGWMAESFVAGKEFSVESFVHRGEVLFTNCTEYVVPRWINLLPAPFPVKKREQIAAFNRQVIETLNIREGMTHLEIFDTPKGLYFGEIAIRPPGGHIMELMSEVYGFDTWQALLQLYLGEIPALPAQPRGCAGVIVIHPGAGVLATIEGLEKARISKGVLALKTSVKAGDTVAERVGCGQEIGHILVKGQTRREVVNDIRQARRYVVTQMA